MIENIFSIPESNVAIIFCEYDNSYLSNKNLERKSNYIMYFNGDGWKKTDWNVNEIKRIGRDISFQYYDGKYYCFDGRNVFESKKGYTWTKKTKDVPLGRCFKAESLYLFTSGRGNSLQISADFNDFHQLILEDGSWEHITPNGNNILAVYSEDNHEKMMKIGQVVIE